MKALVSGKLEQDAAAQISGAARPNINDMPSTGCDTMVKAEPCSSGGGVNGTAVRPQTSCTSSRIT
jgi:hypothetical protein